MPKIPSQPVIAAGVKVLADVYAEIDKQIGKEANTQDQNVSDAEVATFLRQRGALSDTAGAAVASVNAYMRHVVARDGSGGGDVPVDKIKQTLEKVTGYVERDRAKGLDTAQMKPTWRAIALFAEEVKQKGLTAKDIVADRSRRPVGDLTVAQKQLDVVGAVFDEIGRAHGGGTISADAVRAWLATGNVGVATAKEAVRLVTRYLENRTQKTTFTSAEVKGVLDAALSAATKNAAKDDDRSKLATTWQALLAFADENALRAKDARAIVGGAASSSGAGAATSASGPKAASVAAFKALGTDVKAEILEDYGNLHGHYVTTGEKRLDELTGPAKAFAEAMKKELVSLAGDFEDDSGVYGTIGGPRVSVEVISLPSGEIVGGRVHLFQKGFNAENAPPDANGDTPYHFDTAAECTAAGVDADEDISWGCGGLFEVTAAGGAVQLGDSYEHVDDHWEWSGY